MTNNFILPELQTVTRIPSGYRLLNTAFVDERLAAEWVKKTHRFGDSLRRRIRDGGDYNEICTDATRFVSELDHETTWFNHAAILRVRANDPNTRNLRYFAYCNKEHAEGLETYTYGEADAMVSRTRLMFRNHGIGSGSRVAIIGSAPEHIFARNAVLANGGTVSPLSSKYNNEELVKRLGLIEADAIVIMAEFLDQVLAVKRRLPAGLKIFAIERDINGVAFKDGEEENFSAKCKKNGVIALRGNIALLSDKPEPILVPPYRTPAFSMMTSGSSGEMRDVHIFHSYGLGSFIRGNPWWGINGWDGGVRAPTDAKKGPDVVYCTAPAGWMYFYRGLTLAEVAGAEFVIGKTHDNAPDIGFMAELVRRNGVTIFAGIPSLLKRLGDHLSNTETKLPSVRRVISTGEPLPLQVNRDFFRATGMYIANGYAATEEGPMIGYPEWMNLPLGKIGVPLPGTEILLINSQGKATLMSGQPENPQGVVIRQTGVSSEHHYPVRPDGATKTDAGIMPEYRLYSDRDPGGTVRDMNDALQISIHDIAGHKIPLVEQLVRRDDLIKRYAIQIFPAEIAEHLTSGFPNFKGVCVFGMPDNERGNSVVAYIEIPLQDFELMDRGGLRERLGKIVDKISEFKRPDFIFVAPVEYTRIDNKTPVRNIQHALRPIAEALRDKGDRGGTYVLHKSEKIIDNWDEQDIGIAISSLDRLYTRRDGSSQKPTVLLRDFLETPERFMLTDDRIPSVTIALFAEKDGEPYLIFERRPESIRSFPGHLVLPGGRLRAYGLREGEMVMDKYERLQKRSDVTSIRVEDPKEGALREVREELGIPSDQIRILGQFPVNRYMPFSGYMITTLLAQLNPDFDLASIRAMPEEVAEVLYVPASVIFDKQRYSIEPKVLTRRKDGERFIFQRPVISLATDKEMLTGTTATLAQDIAELFQHDLTKLRIALTGPMAMGILLDEFAQTHGRSQSGTIDLH